MPYDSEHGKLWQDIKADFDKTRARASKFADAAEWAFGKRTARVLGVVMLSAVVVALLVVFLNWYVAPTKPSEKKDLVLALAQILAGSALLSGLYFTWRTLQVNREGQITERFTRAIDQLGKVDDKGNKLLEIRLGGIYALERIARESKEDHWPIMEVLTAYVRQNSPSRPFQGQQGEEDATIEKSENGSGGSKKKSAPTDVHAPDPDIQAIMTVLRRRSRSFGHGEPERLDLSETDLTEADLSGADLSGADLTEANLTRANLSGAILQDSLLTEADLSGAILLGANLPGVFLWSANLSGADLSGANLSGAFLTGGAVHLTEGDPEARRLEEIDWEDVDKFHEFIYEQEDLGEGEEDLGEGEEDLGEGDASSGVSSFTEANLREANLTEADLSGAILRGVNLPGAALEGADLSGADLSGAILTKANLREADLTEADLSGADLSGADLRREHTTVILTEASLTGANLSGAILTEGNFQSANLREADLWGADLSGADLRGADLRGASLMGLILSQAQLDETNGDENTRLPPDLKPPAHWNVKTDEQIEED